MIPSNRIRKTKDHPRIPLAQKDEPDNRLGKGNFGMETTQNKKNGLKKGKTA